VSTRTARRPRAASAPRLRAGDVAVFLGPSLPAEEARRIAPCRVLPPARAGDVLALLPERPLAIALVDGLFDAVPSVWHPELLAALDAGVAVFGGASMGALRAAELWREGVIGVGAIFAAYRDGRLDDDGEVALLHAGPEHGYRAFTVPLVTVRAVAGAARDRGVLSAAEARRVVAAARALHYQDRTWTPLLDRARLPAEIRARLEAFLPGSPDPKAEDARACVAAAAEFARARRAGAPPPPGPGARPASHLRRARLARAATVLPGGRSVASGDVLAALARRPDAGRLAAQGVRRALLAALARSFGLAPGAGEAEAVIAGWMRRAGVPRARRGPFLAALGLDDAAARALGEDVALEARLLGEAARVVPDGPSWDEGLAVGARLTGAWIEEADRLAPAPAAPGPARRGRRGGRRLAGAARGR
jgi:hypothetical protein